ncbi:MAG: hypothetical protein HRT57_05285 [Crocinitomicaceae bacterium]|nr:hypothetical protein [Crocinitomicaceae bacterium]
MSAEFKSRFISLSWFKSLYTDHSQLLTEEGFGAFIKRLNSGEGSAIATENSIDASEFAAFKESLFNQQHILFYGWIEQNDVLLEFLEGQEISASFVDKKQHLKHRWGQEFVTFISPFVENRLLKESTRDFKKLEHVFSYTQLIVKDNQALVEAQLYKPIVSLIGVMKHSFVIAEEQALIDLVRPLCSDEILSCVNRLSKRSYGLKLEYVDAILKAIKAKGCTARFANWVLKKMEELDLNEEHCQKIKNLRGQLKAGELQVRNHGEGRTPIRWKTLITLTAILGLLGAMFYIIYYKPFNDVADNELAENASFKKFTVEERKSIDSLIKVMNDGDFTSIYEVDPGVYAPTGGAIKIRYDHKNQLMERIYNDVAKDASIKEYNATKNCTSSIGFERYSGVQDLANKTGTTNSEVRNNSQYDVIIYVSSNTSSGDVYSMLLKKGETISFKMNQYDVFTTVAGNTFKKYVVPDGVTDEVPSISFKRHFCNTDANYFESVDNPLQLIYGEGDDVKILIEGTINGDYNVSDVNGLMKYY